MSQQQRDDHVPAWSAESRTKHAQKASKKGWVARFLGRGWLARGSSSLVSLGLTLSPTFWPVAAYATESDQSEPMQESEEIEEIERLSPSTKAFLDTIAWAEGTSNPDGYQVIFSGGYFYSFDDHPRQVLCALSRGRRLCSSASGRYQFLQRTWDRISRNLGLPDFSPRSQDLAAVELIREQGALADIEAGDLEAAVYKVAPVWASLPSRNGRSVYRQPVRSIGHLRAIYEASLNRYSQPGWQELPPSSTTSLFWRPSQPVQRPVPRAWPTMPTAAPLSGIRARTWQPTRAPNPDQDPRQAIQQYSGEASVLRVGAQELPPEGTTASSPSAEPPAQPLPEVRPPSWR